MGVGRGAWQRTAFERGRVWATPWRVGTGRDDWAGLAAQAEGLVSQAGKGSFLPVWDQAGRGGNQELAQPP